jgi:hypothetical protein
MAGSLLIPMSVTAKVVTNLTNLTNPISVTSLTGAPFNRDAPPLDKGIHVHWALPDALTNARVLSDVPDPTNPGSNHTVIFPGVPDLWLVVRLDPLPLVLGPGFKRSWFAWVVDSRAQSRSTLDKWTVSKTPDGSSVNTVAGLLTSAASLKFPGWGIYDQKKPFDISTAAYYPEARLRFGCYDDSVPVGAAGKVTYIVAGWYSNRDQDPLYNAADRQRLLDRWGISTAARSEGIEELVSSVPVDSVRLPVPWKPASLKLSADAAPAVARLDQAKRSATRGGVREQRVAQLDGTNQSVTLSANSVKDVAVAVEAQGGPAEIICHGSVVEVPLNPGILAQPGLTTSQIQLFPSMTRAMAAIAAAQENNTMIDQVEMLLDNADQQRETMGGILDYPGIAHERNFQGVPGKPLRFARIEVNPLSERQKPASIASIAENAVGGRKFSGFYPNPEVRMSQLHREAAGNPVPPALIQPTRHQLPAGPTQEEVRKWIGDLLTAFQKAIGDAKKNGTPIDERIVRVQDHRSIAHPPSIGRSVDGSGPEQAGYWLEIDLQRAQEALARAPRALPGSTSDILTKDPTIKVLSEFYAGAAMANVSLPHYSNLHEIPGPRWYRPWSPQLVISGAGRSYRFGEDDRFGGIVQARVSGETLSALRVGKLRSITGRELLANAGPLSATPGIPSEVRSLVEETMLQDSDCGGVMAAQGVGTSLLFQKAIQSTWLMRDPALSESDRNTLSAVQPIGLFPSPIAITPWKDPTDPLFVDVKYAHPFSDVEQNWTLLPDHVDMTPKDDAPIATQPVSSANVKTFDDAPVPPNPPPGERARLTASICKVLDSSLVSNMTIDPNGFQSRAQAPPPSIDEDTFTQIDLLSAALTQFDDKVFAAGRRQRSGALRINHIDLVDVYGVARRWDSPTVPDNSPAGGDALPYWTQLTPRLPYWSRLQHRLVSASNPAADASGLEPAICGFLLPDFVEHSLEVLDGSGRPIGEITSVRPQSAEAAAVPKGLKVEFHVHPWLGLKDEPASIVNATLRSVVYGIAAQSRDIPARTPDNTLETFESGLTAFLRVVDTIRSTVDPTVIIPDGAMHLMGEPIVVVKTLLSIEATAPENRPLLYGDPPPLLGLLPKIHVRIGDITRPDDGVLGLFVPGATDDLSRFNPVSSDAIESAIVNGLAEGVLYLQRPADDPFLIAQESGFDVTVGAPPVPLTILMDTRGGIYTTCGVLPRKKITLPADQLSAALTNIEASFRTGPILAVASQGVEKTAIPAIDLKGYKTSFIRAKTDHTFGEVPVPEIPPLGELPLDRALLSSGWLRVTRRDPNQN